jgi:hypothetical protein
MPPTPTEKAKRVLPPNQRRALGTGILLRSRRKNETFAAANHVSQSSAPRHTHREAKTKTTRSSLHYDLHNQR